MKSAITIALFVFLLVPGMSLPAWADPRMETNRNFCHYILDPVNTDNEIFVAGCDSVITVTTNGTDAAADAAGDAKKVGNTCSEYRASGFGTVTRVIPQDAIPLAPGHTVKFTSADSDTPCTMVESNGRQYRSHKWESRISVSRVNQQGMVTVVYKLICLDGQQ